MTLLQKASIIASDAHNGQFRRDGVTPYISHPMAVARLVASDEATLVALLHDVIEDTNVVASYLTEAGMPHNVVRAVLRLTKDKEQSYKEYITRISKDKLATQVKIADIFHNISDSPTINAKAKYLKALPELLEALSNNNF